MSLRERLAARSRPSVQFPLRIEDDAAAQAELADARDSGDPDRIAAAEGAVAACYETLTITALSPVDWEALVAAHPPTAEQRAKGAWCNNATFLPALLAACVAGEETEDDWADFTSKGSLSLGEANALFDVAMNINQRAPEPSVPKGSTPTPN